MFAPFEYEDHLPSQILLMSRTYYDYVIFQTVHTASLPLNISYYALFSEMIDLVLTSLHSNLLHVKSPIMELAHPHFFLTQVCSITVLSPP